VPASFKRDGRKWAEIMGRVQEYAGGASVKIGVLQSTDKQVEGADITLAELAAIHEYGAPKAGIPERSFLRRTFRDARGKGALEEHLKKLAKAIVKGKINPDQALEMLGQWGVAAVKGRIKDHIPPPLAVATIKRKKSETPLVDTGQLINAITYEIVE
jgi:hypothetical protein